MSPRRVLRGTTVMAVLAVLAALLATPVSAGPSKGGSDRYLVRARSAADYGALRAKAVQQGAKILGEIPQIRAMVVSAPDAYGAGMVNIANP